MHAKLGPDARHTSYNMLISVCRQPGFACIYLGTRSKLCCITALIIGALPYAAGMKCGGCVGHVKQLLEQHPSVTAATVNLATETALVRVKLEPGADLTAIAADLAKVRVERGDRRMIGVVDANAKVCVCSCC